MYELQDWGLHDLVTLQALIEKIEPYGVLSIPEELKKEIETRITNLRKEPRFSADIYKAFALNEIASDHLRRTIQGLPNWGDDCECEECTEEDIFDTGFADVCMICGGTVHIERR